MTTEFGEKENQTNDNQQNNELANVKSLLFKPEIEKLEKLELGVEKLQRRIHPDAILSDLLVSLEYSQEDSLLLKRWNKVLKNSVTGSLHVAVQENSEQLAETLYPVMGPAIRKSVMETLRNFTEQMNAVLEQAVSLQGWLWRFEAWRAGISFPKFMMMKSVLYRVDHVRWISKGNFSLLAEVENSSVLKDPSQADAISRILFAFEKVLGKDIPQTLSLEDLRLLCFEGEQSYLVVVCFGNAFGNISEVAQEILLKLEKEFGSHLNSKSDSRIFLSAKEDLKRCLVEKKCANSSEKEGQGEAKNFGFLRKNAKAVGFLLVCFVLLSSLFGYRKYKQNIVKKEFDSISYSIKSKPGWNVSEMNYSDTSVEIKGFADPLAQTPEEINEFKASKFFSRHKIKYSIVSFLSLHPEIILKRAKKVLSPPGSVTLKLTAERVLIATGAAPAPWRIEARMLSRAIEGVDKYDDSALDTIENGEFFASVAKLQNYSFTSTLLNDEKELQKIVDLILNVNIAAKKISESYYVQVSGINTGIGVANLLTGKLEWRLEQKGVTNYKLLRTTSNLFENSSETRCLESRGCVQFTVVCSLCKSRKFEVSSEKLNQE